jgi:phytoene dehydrogenase-like protein
VVLSTELDRTAASVAAFAKPDGDAWRAEFEQWQRVRDPLLEALLRPFPPLRASGRLLRELGSADALRFARTLVSPVRRFTEERFAGEGARLLLTGSALHTDLVPGDAGSALFGWLLTMLGQEVGFPVPEGGAGSLADALVRRLESRGGQLRCGQPVERVLIGRGTAVGVRVAGGGLVRARRAVVADVPAPDVYLRLVGPEHLPSRLLTDLERFVFDDSTIKVDWALSRPIPWTAREVSAAGTVHLGADMDGLTSFGACLARKEIPADPFVLLGQMTTADPSRSPAGTESVWAYTHVPRGLRWSRDDLLRHAERVERLVERHAPGFAGSVLARTVSGPAELMAHNPSLVDGAINAGSSIVSQQLVFRPVPGLGRADTVIDRLYLASASAHPGGGVHGAPGGNAARAALARSGVLGGPYGLAIRTAHSALYR